MAVTRRTSPRPRPSAAQPEQEAASEADTPTRPVTTARGGAANDESTQEPTVQLQAQNADVQDARADAAEAPAASAAPRLAPQLPVDERPLTPTQVLNDPLLATHSEIIVDLGRKLRWAAVGYGALGIVASWIIAPQVALAAKTGTPFLWSLAATVLIVAGALWYLAGVSTRYASIAAYRKAKTPQTFARLDRGAVVGLYGVIGTWIGVGLAALVVVSGTVTAVLTLALGASGWAWFFGALPAVLLYAYGFGLLHYRLIEKTRDAVA